jgi:hypothetical protein
MVFAAAAADPRARARSPTRNRRPYISNGRIVVSQSSQRPPSFSKRKFLFLWIVGAAFWCTNPANNNALTSTSTTLETLYRDYLEPLGFPASSFQSPPPPPPPPGGVKNAKRKASSPLHQHVTNFGFFSLNERITRVDIHVLGQTFGCRFGDETLGGWFCQAIIVPADMCHQKPLFWDPHDRPYTTHRLFSWSLIAAGMLAFAVQDEDEDQDQRDSSNRKHAAFQTGNLLVDSFLTIWFPSDGSSSSSSWWTCLRSTVGAVWQSSFLLYPVWTRMDVLVPLQHPDSWFRIVDHDHDHDPNQNPNDWNYVASVLFVLLLAAGSNAACKMITGRFRLRKCDAVVAVALGYYRGSLSGTGGGGGLTFPLLSSVNLTALHWTAFLLLLTRMDASVLFWLYANMLGAVMGEYQYQNQLTLALARQVWRSFENFVDAFFGYW